MTNNFKTAAAWLFVLGLWSVTLAFCLVASGDESGGGRGRRNDTPPAGPAGSKNPPVKPVFEPEVVARSRANVGEY